jgi:hypothetical protein
MITIAELLKPYTDAERMDFIVEYNHNQGYTIEETEDSLQALGYTEEEQALQEKERIAKLYLTGADVERGIYQAKGMDFDDIIALVEKLSQTIIDEETGEVIQQGIDIDVKALKIELKANNFYRGNPYVSAVGALLGFTDEMLDKFFEDGNYEHLIPPVVEEEIVEEPIEETEDEDTTNATI